MLEMADVGPRDIVYDLGCGDGRILFTAIERFGAKKAVGYEINKDLYMKLLREIEHRGLHEKIKVVHGDLFKADISEATVITLYLTGGANNQLKAKLEKEARSGTRIVSHDFDIRGFKQTRKETFGKFLFLSKHTLYLFVACTSVET
jgi:16S rRNA A1518/A1519 N6-dimethyltransferase RsmA/KsgA/DIM1 with predicted DNA glycosylase/AP lyase activity